MDDRLKHEMDVQETVSPQLETPSQPLLDAVVETTERLTYAERKELAEIMARAGVFPGVTDKYKAMAVIEMGRFFSMEPTEALLNIQIGLQGAPAVHYSWQLKRLRQLGHDYNVLSHDERHCKIEFYRKQKGTITATYLVEMSVDQAAKIAITDKQQGGNATLGGKWNWKNYPKSMVLGFCARNGIRWYFPEVLGGMVESDEVMATEMYDAGVTEGRPTTAETTAENVADLSGDDDDTFTQATRGAYHKQQIAEIVGELGFTLEEFGAWLEFGTGKADIDQLAPEEAIAVLAHLRVYKHQAFHNELAYDDAAEPALFDVSKDAATQRSEEPV